MTVTGILAATLTRYGWPHGIEFVAALHWAPDGWYRFTTDVGHSEEILLNIALFVPAGALLTYATRRPGHILGALVLLSAGIELLQGVLALGAPDLADLLSNSLGAICGVFLGTAAACLVPRATTASPRHRPVRMLTSFVVAAGLCAALIPLAARQHEKTAEAAVASRFKGDTLIDYDRWSRQGVLGQRVFTVNHMYSTGATQNSYRAEVRYSTSFLGIQQCLMTTWTTSGVTIARRTGDHCTHFMG